MLAGAVFLAGVTGCAEDPVVADADGQAIVYGSVEIEGAGPAVGAIIDGVVYKGAACGDEFAARPFHTETDSSGAYRIHLMILTRDPFWGCVEVVGADTALGLTSVAAFEERVYFDISAPFDSVRVDVTLR